VIKVIHWQMKRKRIPMSLAEYEVLEHPFGWKVEYWDGQAQLSPREFGMTTRIGLQPRHLEQNHTLISVDVTYAEQMIAGYFEVFADSVEFCDWPQEEVQKSAQKCIKKYFAGEKGETLPASAIALDPDSQDLAGLALFALNREKKPHLELLYVRRPFQRTGMATAMVTWGMNNLTELGFQELFSTYHVCNDSSRQWHHRFGFQDIYDLYYIRHKFSWLEHEIWRREKIGSDDGIASLIQEQNQWRSLLDLSELL
jgi:GNAT superfamily N-acetyltransferase